MKRPAAIFAALFLCLKVAHAGPQPVIPDQKDKVVMLPEQHEECTWGGFYIGGNVGGAFDSIDVDTNLTGGWEGFPEDRGTAKRLANHDLDADGFVAGGF